jgi:DNA-directed RNA polymerase specialized sigma24 family protein
MRRTTDFEEFYAANYGKITALVTGVLGDWAEADDIAQETFARALARWPRLSSYEEGTARRWPAAAGAGGVTAWVDSGSARIR